MSAGKSGNSGVERFVQIYNRVTSRAMLLVEKEVIGANVGANGYTTVTQADSLAEHLALRPGTRLLDIGAGRGWPGLHLAKKTGCEVVLTDLPLAALRDAVARAGRQRLKRRCAFLLASGARLPFRLRTFDSIVHTDVLC